MTEEKLQKELEISYENATPTKHFSSPPYHVESFGNLHCVCNPMGFNCLSFKDKPGAKFTTSVIFAEYVANKWNELQIRN